MSLVAFGGSLGVMPGPVAFPAGRHLWLKFGGRLLIRLLKGLGIRRRLLSIPSEPIFDRSFGVFDQVSYIS